MVCIDLREGFALEFLVVDVFQQAVDCERLQAYSIALQSFLDEPPVVLLLLSISEQALEYSELPLDDHALPEIFCLE